MGHANNYDYVVAKQWYGGHHLLPVPTTSNSNPEDPVNDTFPGLMIGLSSVLGTFWWLISWFVYIRNRSNDGQLKNLKNVEVLPISYFWERIGELNGDYVYMAISMFMTFWCFIVVSLVEMVAWALYLTGYRSFFDWYVRTVGYYGSISLYGIPVIFAILQAYVKDGGDLRVSPGAYMIWLISVGGTYWMINAWIHIMYTPRLKAHVQARKE